MLSSAARAMWARASGVSASRWSVAAVASQAPSRGYAAAAASSEAEASVSPSVHLYGLSGRYAHALFSSASKAGIASTVEQELSTLNQVIQKQTQFREFLADPVAPAQDKLAALTELGKQAKLSDTTKNFLAVLAENRRLSELPDIASDFATLMQSSRGEVEAVITSADPLTEHQLASVEGALSKFLHEGQSMKVSTQIDPSILGGLVVDIGDRHIDMSMASRINKLKRVLEEEVV